MTPGPGMLILVTGQAVFFGAQENDPLVDWLPVSVGGAEARAESDPSGFPCWEGKRLVTFVLDHKCYME